jgi:hypothetical protein
MPATIIGSTEWNTRGLVLTRQDAQEQVNGLVTVQCEYVGPAEKHDIISRSFYTDAPPPIWPSVVNKNELLGNRLYMESRSVTRANGLTQVNASYVGGLVRTGFAGYYLRTARETGGTVTGAYEGVLTPLAGGIAYSLETNATLYGFNGEFIKHTMEFVQVGEAISFAKPELTFSDMYVPTGGIKSGGENLVPSAEDPNTMHSLFTLFYSAPGAGGIVLVKNGGYVAAKFVDKPSFITPTVKLIEREFYF